ncbi:MAG: class I SAM-dependent methyltransferase [Acidobacteriota bacterium]
MRSQFADEFNHDHSAAGYDADVADESNPIREGYAATLRWVAERCAIAPTDRVLDLGCGTGNLALQLLPSRLTGVDVSANMLAIAREKLAEHDGVDFVQDDLLACLEGRSRELDVVASTYAIHHLTEDEKSVLHGRIREALRAGGRVAFGDLMFADDEARAAFLDDLREKGKANVAAAIEEEFFWSVARNVERLEELGFAVETKQFSRLSWGIAARLAG